MAATPDQRRDFGQRLRALRTSHGHTQPVLGELLEQHGGYNVTAPAVSDWERGVSAPDQRNASALERVFGEPVGSLAGLLGYRGDDPSTAAEISDLRREVAELRTLVERLGTPADAPQPDGAER